jgi:hypothetical protein
LTNIYFRTAIDESSYQRDNGVRRILVLPNVTFGYGGTPLAGCRARSLRPQGRIYGPCNLIKDGRIQILVRRLIFALSGRPPNLPFLRDAAAFRLERTDPRHAGQKDIK